LSDLFLSHDLGMVEYIADRIAVMYLSKVVEMNKESEICRDPRHPYTQALMGAIPIPMASSSGKQRKLLSGDVSSPIELPSGCSFLSRCPQIMERCRQEEHRSLPLTEGGEVTCHLYESTPKSGCI
jgi:oligopeptide/dipeptide ABC transporter ATP-binding protein